MRFLLAIVVVTASAVVAASASSESEAAVSQTFISGGLLAQPIRLAAADEDAFVRRLNVPPRLEETPGVSGPSYNISSPYWTQVMPGAPGVRAAAGANATYYPQGGYIEAVRSDGSTTWLVLDVRQQAIIARYIRLGERGLISPFPGILQVLRADAMTGEAIGVQLGSRQFSTTEASAFWEAVPVDTHAIVGVNPAPIALVDEVARPHEPPASAAWLLITPTEGRTIELLYRYDLGLLYDLVGQQAYPVPTSLFSSILGTDGSAGSDATAPASVPQDQGAGSPLWWGIMVGGGAILLGAAFYLNQKWRKHATS